MPSYGSAPSFFTASGVIFGAALVALAWAALQFTLIQRIPVESAGPSDGETSSLLEKSNGGGQAETTARLNEIYTAIYEGAESFLRAEYYVCGVFISCFALIILVLVSWGTGWDFVRGSFTTISFLLGALTSMASGYLGMKVAVFSNVRTTISAQQNGWTACFNTAFRAGAVMGFALCGLGMLMLYATMLLFRAHYSNPMDWIYLTECITGYGLGGRYVRRSEPNDWRQRGIKQFVLTFVRVPLFDLF